MNWIEIYNRLFEIINELGDNYYSGLRFINVIKEYEPYFADYTQYIEERRHSKKSTARKDYFRDILLSFPEGRRIEIIRRIIQDTQFHNPIKTSELKSIVDGGIIAPNAKIDFDIWGSDKLNSYLEDIDVSISQGNHKRAITLSYTCLEGFFKAFIEHNIPDKKQLNGLIVMSKTIQKYLKNTIASYPDEALTLIKHIAHTVDKSRNQFSESHFGEEAEKWLSTFIRDCVNSAIRLLLCFM